MIFIMFSFFGALKNFVCIPIDFDPGLSKSITPEDLPDNWMNDPIPQPIKDMGDRWVQGQHSVILKVPSAIIPAECNYLINPSHPDFKKVTIHIYSIFNLSAPESIQRFSE